jgi:translocation and assembly module TamA
MSQRGLAGYACAVLAGRGARIGRDPNASSSAALIVLIALLFVTGRAWPSAGGAAYHLALETVGDAAIDAAVEQVSLLAALRDQGPVLPVALIGRAEADRIRIDDTLRSFGYYDAVINIDVNGVDLAEPSLPELLQTRTGDGAVRVGVRIDKGPLYRLAGVGVDGMPQGAAAAALDLRTGEPAAAGPVLAQGAALLESLREDGFALARVPPPQATVDHRSRTMDVRYRLEPGPRVAIGSIEITGLEYLSEAFVRRRLGLQPGDAYSPSRLEQARRDLTRSAAVTAARVVPAPAVDADGRLPLRVAVVEGKRRSIRVAGTFASDDGASLLLGWTHRNLFGGAEELSLRGEVGTIDGHGRDDLDYAAGLSLRLPDRGRRDLDVVLDLGAVSESLDAYDREALSAGAGLEQRLSPRLALSLGLAFEHARIAQDGPAQDYRLLSLPLVLSWDATGGALSPRDGMRLSAELVPVPWVQGGGNGFARASATAAGFLDLGAIGAGAGAAAAADTPGSSVVAGRLALGRIVGAQAGEVPPDWRLFAGGAGSVRGYPYQSIGPRTASGAPAGGAAAVEASLEFRRRLGGPWGLVAFADAGSVTAAGLPELGETKLGVGLGVRFHTIIGPLRADLAVPLDPHPDDAPAQLYLGIGEAF